MTNFPPEKWQTWFNNHYFSYRRIIPRGDMRIGDKHPMGRFASSYALQPSGGLEVPLGLKMTRIPRAKVYEYPISPLLVVFSVVHFRLQNSVKPSIRQIFSAEYSADNVFGPTLARGQRGRVLQ